MKRLLACLAVFALSPACGIAEDDTAATVDGHDISVESVRRFARSSYIAQVAQNANAPLVSPTKGSTGGAKLRLALGTLVQAQAFRDAVAAGGGSVTKQDTDSAEQQIASYEAGASKLGASDRKVLLGLVAAQEALLRLGGASTAVKPEQIAAYFDAHRSEFSEVTCVNGFAVLEATRAAAQAAIDRGEAADAILADAALQAKPLTGNGGEACISKGDVTDKSLSGVIETGPIGRWSSATIADPRNGNITLFVNPTSRTAPTARTPLVVQKITAVLQKEAEAKAQAKAPKLIQKALDDARVEIDPRYGTWDPRSRNGVSPPPVPAVTSAATTTAPGLGGA